MSDLAQATERLIDLYRAFSPTSARLAERTQTVFPGGDTRSSAHYAPYPLAIARGEGARIYTVDGHEILDFMNNFTSLIHGHAEPSVVRAIQEQAALGTAYAAPNDAQVGLAELIVERVKSVEQLRFTSSGTEATLMAIRCARAATGREKIMKIEGGYHGSYELAEVSLVPLAKSRGPSEQPASTPVDASFPTSVLSDTVICPFNDVDVARTLIEAHGDELAAVIVEPVLGSMGMLPANPDFLAVLRELTQAKDIVLIFDEVITLRLDTGGAQAIHGIEPDLTSMGKIIGGGLPIGAIGGRRALMQLFSPERKVPVMHASTFSGNALSMAAGLAAMQNYTTEEVAHVNRLGQRLRDNFNNTLTQAGLNAQAVGQGSLSNLHFSTGAITNARDNLDTVIAAGVVPQLLHLGMLRRGVMSASRLMYCTSTGMTKPDLDTATTALNDTIAELRPLIEDHYPHLIAH